MTAGALLFVGGALLSPLAAQPAPPLSLRDVLLAVDSAAYGTRAARADARAADASVTESLAGYLPAFRLEAGSARTTDPIGVFGAKLRQRIVTAADFDPARLNRPDAITMTTGAIVLEQPLFAPQAWLGRRAATLAARAQHAAADQTASTAQLSASRSYFGAIVAAASVSALDVAVAAGEAHVRQAATLERNGVVTHSDVLLAEVRLRELESRRASARGDALMARLALAVQMGQPADTVRPLPPGLPSTEAVLALIAQGWPNAGTAPANGAARGDVTAARLGAQAAQSNVRRATARWLPTVGAMARSDWAASGQPFAGSPYWTAGVMVSLPVFSGGADLADRQRAVAQLRAAESRAEGAAAQATLEATQTSIARSVSVERLLIAERALSQSTEALRLVQRRYDGGLAAITELLDAGAARTSSELSVLAARHEVLVALAAERVALGFDLTPLLSLDR
jgi:outer membrane protein TolC